MGFINKRRAVLGIVRQVDAEWFRNTLDTIKAGTPAMAETLGYNGFPRGEPVMVKHGALTKSHVYHLLRSNDARVRHAAFTVLERSNPTLRRDRQLFVEITRFIWDANPSYDLYNEFTKRHFQANYKVHELIIARLKTEKQNKQSGAADDLTADTLPHVYEGGFFKRLFRRRSSRR
jgi:hypothetical protein